MQLIVSWPNHAWEFVVWIFNTFDNNFRIKSDFTKYLKESYWIFRCSAISSIHSYNARKKAFPFLVTFFFQKIFLKNIWRSNVKRTWPLTPLSILCKCMLHTPVIYIHISVSGAHFASKKRYYQFCYFIKFHKPICNNSLVHKDNKRSIYYSKFYFIFLFQIWRR